MTRYGLPLTVLAVLMTGASTAALAQAPGADEPVTIEEVIITARKKAENLQDTPISVTAFTAQAIERAGLKDFGDVAQRTPGMQFGDFGDLKLSPTSLRGIVGGSGSAGADPAVGIYVDEIFLGQGAGANLDLYDIERVEVLRGPQGTLFGRNTIGGVVNVTTKRPTEELEASATFDVGNYSYLRGAASISGPILPERVLGKIAVIAEDRDGTSENAWLHRDVNTVGNWSVRGQLLFKFNPDTDLLLTADYKDVDQESLVFETLSYVDTATLPQLLDLNGLPRNTNPYDYKVYADQPTVETLTQSGIAATFRTKLGGVNFTNIASYREHDYYSRVDTDRSPLAFLYDGDPETVWRFSEELRAAFSTGPVDWLAGVYYYRQNTKNLSFVEIGPDLADLFGDPSISGLQTGSDAELDTTSTAVFASATWRITDKLDATIGGRYTRDEKTIDYSQSDPLGLLGGDFAVKASDEWAEFTPNFNVRYRFTDDVMAYVTVSKGFKSGGFNDALGDANGIGFGPESLWNYEAGLKTELFDRRVVANVALYRMEWSDIQISQDNPATPLYDPIITNAGSAHSQGVEVEVVARPNADWTFGLSGSVMEATYDEGVIPVAPPTPPTPLDRIPYASDYTANAWAEYRLPTRVGDFRFFGEMVARGESYLTLNTTDPDSRVAPNQLFNARISWDSLDGRFTLTAWGKNLTEEVVKQRLFDLSGQDLVGQKNILLNEPRTYGLTLKVKY